MQILLSCAKDMHECAVPAPQSVPAYQAQADELARDMAGYSPGELMAMLGLSERLGRDVWRRYQRFFQPGAAAYAAIAAYCGVAYKAMDAEAWTEADRAYAQGHLWITSFLYGLLRPLDRIALYRLEGNVRLTVAGGETVFRYWRERLTPTLLEACLTDDGILVDLSSAEMRNLYDRRRADRELTVVSPQFLVDKSGRLTMPSVYAKKCRGAMTSWIVRERVNDPLRLREFVYDGFEYRGEAEGDDGSVTSPVFVKQM